MGDASAISLAESDSETEIHCWTPVSMSSSTNSSLSLKYCENSWLLESQHGLGWDDDATTDAAVGVAAASIWLVVGVAVLAVGNETWGLAISGV